MARPFDKFFNWGEGSWRNGGRTTTADISFVTEKYDGSLGILYYDDPADADVILINTCTVRAKPEQKAVSLLGRMTAIKRRKPGA